MTELNTEALKQSLKQAQDSEDWEMVSYIETLLMKNFIHFIASGQAPVPGEIRKQAQNLLAGR